MNDAQKIIQNELDLEEKLLWAGKPKQGIVFQKGDIFMIPFSLLWGGMILLIEILLSFLLFFGGKGIEGIIFAHLFLLPFVIIGLHMIFGRFITDLKRRANTFYGLTDQRAIIISGIFSKTVKSLNLISFNVSLSEKSNKSGTITFGQEMSFYSAYVWNSNHWLGMASSVPKFEFIENAKEVYDQISKQQNISKWCGSAEKQKFPYNF